ncbi:hypothetical protein [Enhydrobacter aerosaccus]|uniref:hypothetical protein n=1 Tax=Enhydrobacter aerosaccus TaxID=225324 RepID=UPI0011168814|nr:hypothetical protein [Enhydrobacter aerosaccus]
MAVGVMVFVLAGLAEMAHAQIDTEHMFGFSEGSDIGRRGDREVEIETVGGFGRDANSYSAVTTNVSFKYGVTDYFRIAPSVEVGRWDVAGLPGVDDQHQFGVDALSLEMRFHLLDRLTQPVGLTLMAAPFVGFIDPSLGVAGDRIGAAFLLAVDRALVPNQLFVALNLHYDFESDRPSVPGLVTQLSNLAFSVAFSRQVMPWLYVGGEARYLRTYDGLALGTLAGQALYVGPVFYIPVSRRFTVSGAWEPQVWGQDTVAGGGLDLLNYERQQVKLRLSLAL